MDCVALALYSWLDAESHLHEMNGIAESFVYHSSVISIVYAAIA